MSNTLSPHPGRSHSPTMRLFIAIIFALWFALVFWLGAHAAFATPREAPPLLLLAAVLMPIAVFLVAFWTWRAFRDFVLKADLCLLTGAQAWRFVGFGFLGFYAQGLLPGYFAWPAALGDMAIGLTAPWLVVALLRQRSFATSRAFIAWNIFGILDFVVAVGMGAIAPLLFADLARNVTTAPMVHLPLVLIPTFLVPMFMILHLVALFRARTVSALRSAKMIDPSLRSPREKVGGLYHFGRMIDKIRLHLRGELPEEYKANFGLPRGLDGLLARFLNLTLSEIIARVKQGGTDEEILEWCFASGLRPNETQIRVWNSFSEKIGWRDAAAPIVEQVKKQTDRTDIATIFDCIDASEGRLAFART
jgi:hypothetical protein